MPRTSSENCPYDIEYRSQSADEKVMSEILLRRAYRKPLLNFDVEPDDVWIDLGAHIGIFSLYAVAQGAKCVYSYEPNPESFELMQRNVRRNRLLGAINPSRVAIVAKRDAPTMTLYVPTDPQRNWRASVFRLNKSKALETEVKTFNEVIRAHPDATAVKLDIERAEIDILRDPDIELDNINKLVFEYTMASYAIDDIERNLTSKGFYVHVQPSTRTRYKGNDGKEFNGMMDKVIFAVRDPDGCIRKAVAKRASKNVVRAKRSVPTTAAAPRVVKQKTEAAASYIDLVQRCATQSGRTAANSLCYVRPATIQRQKAALGHGGVQKLIDLYNKTSPLTQPEREEAEQICTEGKTKVGRTDASAHAAMTALRSVLGLTQTPVRKVSNSRRKTGTVSRHGAAAKHEFDERLLDEMCATDQIVWLSERAPFEKVPVNANNRQNSLNKDGLNTASSFTATCGAVRPFNVFRWQVSDWLLMLCKRQCGKLLIQRLNQLMHENDPSFRWSNIQFNKNWPGVLHCDRGNIGASRMLTCGIEVIGGQLYIYNSLISKGKIVDTLDRIIAFDGNHPHATMEYTGTRYSFVFFTATNYVDFEPKDEQQAQQLIELKFKLPDEEFIALRRKPKNKRTRFGSTQRELLDRAKTEAVRLKLKIPSAYITSSGKPHTPASEGAANE
jgi:FkbM family methyltransferase